MLQVQILRNDPAGVKEKLAIKHFANTGLVDHIIELDDERKRLQLESDSLLASVNTASKAIGQLMAKGQKDEAEAKKAEVAALKEKLQPLSGKLSATEKKLNDQLVLLPNLPSPMVPAGKTPADNIVDREGGNKPKLAADAVSHWDLIRK